MNLEEFQRIPAGEIFRVVTTKYHTAQFINGVTPDLTFVCKKGHGYDDWAIYYHYAHFDPEVIARNGDKLVSEENIRSIFPCDDEVFNKYRT